MSLPRSHQEIVEQIDLMLRARYPLIYIVGAEEEPIETVLLQVADKSQPARELRFWDIVRGMIKIVEAVAPCVLWMDEIDKAFGNISSGFDGDSGRSRRVFGSLITKIYRLII